MTMSALLHATTLVIKRDRYGAIYRISGTEPHVVMQRFAKALPEPYFVRHSSHLRESLNWSLYGYDPEEDVAVVQVRQFRWNSRREYGTLHKTYALCGRKEISGEAIRHPVSPAAVHGAIRKAPDDPAAPVRGAQRWMWSVTEKQLARATRQGEVLIVPERTPQVVAELGTNHVVTGSHEIRATRVVQAANGQICALNLTRLHRNDQQDPICATEHDGWCSVRVAREEPAWGFAMRLRD